MEETRRSFKSSAGLVGLLLLSVLALSVAFGFLPQTAFSQSNEQAVARQLAERITTKLEQASQSLESLAEDPKTIRLFKQANPARLASAANRAVESIDSAIGLRYFLPGEYQLDRNSSPPIGFASLDLLKRAETTSEVINAEFLRPGVDQEHIVLIERVKQGEDLLGLIHLSLDPQAFQTLAEDLVGQGYAELVQDLSSKVVVLGKAGFPEKRIGEATSADVDGAFWRVDYWPALAVAKHETDTGVDYLAYLPTNNPMLLAGGGILILLLLFMFFRKRGSKRETKSAGKGQVIYDGAVKAIMDGKHPGMEELVPDLPDLGQSNEVKPVSQGMSREEADDITEIVRPEKSGQSQTTPEETSAGVDEATIKTAQKPAGGAPVTQATAEVEEPQSTKPEASEVQVPASIFRAYDIRGVVGKTLTPETVYLIGQAIGSVAGEQGQQRIAVGRDGRLSSPPLSDALIRGLRESGRDVIDIGVVPTPLLYFATQHLDTQSGVMVTGSHNGPEYNGLKIMLGGETLSGETIQTIHQRAADGTFSEGAGSLEHVEITAEYIRRATKDVPVALGGAFKLVVDCGNGVAGAIAPQLYRAMGHDVIELFCEVDGQFPNHHPDPSQPENLETLIAKVKETGADLGFAFDGDGDRLGVVDNQGSIIWPDRQMMLFAQDVLSRNQGKPIIFDVKCSRFLKKTIEEAGGIALMWKTGHSLIKSKMKAVGAPLAGEMSGHIFFSERWYGFDDALYSGVRLLEILSKREATPTEVFANLPESCSTPELRIPLAEKHHAKFMELTRKKMSFDNAEITDIDGLRVDFPHGWGLVRPSNTSPFLVARFEADDEETLEKIKSDFRTLLKNVAPDLKIPF